MLKKGIDKTKNRNYNTDINKREKKEKQKKKRTQGTKENETGGDSSETLISMRFRI